MASKLTKDDYQKALSAEYGFPVFLTDAEFERLQVSKPNPQPTPTEKKYQDPFEYMGDWRKQKDTEASLSGARAKAAHESAYATPAPSATPEAPASGKIGKIAMPSAAGPDDSIPTMTYQEPPTLKGIGIEKGWHPKPVDQYAFDHSDFGIPASGDPIKASAPLVVTAPGIVGNPDNDPWERERQEIAIKMNDALQAKLQAKATVDAVKKGKL
jgi:hypothetical protein